MRAMFLALAAGGVLSGCAAPFGLGEPSSPALERGAENSLNATAGYEMTGTYTEGGQRWTIDLQIERPAAEHIQLKGPQQLEITVVGGQAYFRGQSFLQAHVGSDPLSLNLVKATGNGWWKGTSASPPQMPDLTQGSVFRATFLGSAASRRTDHVVVDGVDAVELSGQRADVYIAEAAPNRLVRLHLNRGVVVDGMAEADLHFAGYDQDFHIATPTDVVDFSNLSTLPPVYTVLSVDTSNCASPCVVSAQLRNLGGARGAKGPSTVTFTMKDAASGQVVGSCQAVVSPDVGYNGTTSVSCTIANISGQQNADTVTATADNPGRG